MESSIIQPGNEINLFVKNIVIFEESSTSGTTVLPFFADGFPGFVFHNTPNGLRVQPQNKIMPVGFLYGQTLHPTELHLSGSFKLIVFQLYPFVLTSFFGVNPKELNDSCYDLLQVPEWKDYQEELTNSKQTSMHVKLITQFLSTIFAAHQQKMDAVVRESIIKILEKKAQINVKELCEVLHVTVRTFERRFLKEVGISPKDFIQITRFQQSLEQLSVNDYNKLTDIVYTNGFVDQSHFIRVFKAFTGKTPSRFLKS